MYVDGSLSERDSSIIELYNQDITQNASIVDLQNTKANVADLNLKIDKSGGTFTGNVNFDENIYSYPWDPKPKVEVNADFAVEKILIRDLTNGSGYFTEGTAEASAGAYLSNGTTYVFHAYALKTIGAVQYVSTNPTVITITDGSTGFYGKMDFYWDNQVDPNCGALVRVINDPQALQYVIDNPSIPPFMGDPSSKFDFPISPGIAWGSIGNPQVGYVDTRNPGGEFYDMLVVQPPTTNQKYFEVKDGSVFIYGIEYKESSGIPANTYLKEASIGTGLAWNAGHLDVSINTGSLTQDTSIPVLFNKDLAQDGSITDLRTADLAFATNASIGLAGFLKNISIKNIGIGSPIVESSTNSSATFKTLIAYSTNIVINPSDFGGNTISFDLGTAATNILAGAASKVYVDGSLSALNSSVNTAFGAYATNSSINSAGFLKSVDLGPYATNASVNNAGFATNVSVGLSIQNFATNSSVNLAFLKFIPSASVGASSSHSVYWNAGYLEASMGSGVGVTSLVNLTDVSIVSPVNNQVLSYDSATSKYKLKAVVDISVYNVADASAYFPTITDVSTTYLRINDASTTYAKRLLGFTSAVSAFTVSASENNNVIDASGTFSIYFPTNVETGWQTTVINIGPGIITLSASTGATLISSDSSVNLRGKGDGASIIHRGSGMFYLNGYLR